MQKKFKTSIENKQSFNRMKTHCWLAVKPYPNTFKRYINIAEVDNSGWFKRDVGLVNSLTIGQ